MDIRQSSVRITRCCRAGFVLESWEEAYCPVCKKKDPEMFAPWFSQDGKKMFELVSDVSGR